MSLQVRVYTPSSFKFAVYKVFASIFMKLRRLIPSRFHLRLLLMLMMLLGIKFVEYKWRWDGEKDEWTRA
ncbi:hypothetical protein JDFR1000234_17 [uncultured archaeal virus]|uniref:Uncharacterized protein n=1 Tax=uncultured archaeal virus TaxID=1960247 RepID=A0A1S5Y331_9VIRU|nr:hypothetical protein JDFR1000234_17 [uncultured archaeal virus]